MYPEKKNEVVWVFHVPNLICFEKVRKDRIVRKDQKERMDLKEKRANGDQGECREHVMLRYSPQDIWAFLGVVIVLCLLSLLYVIS